MNDRRFSADEAGRLIRRATELSQRDDDGLTYDQLLEIAGEVGIAERDLEAALQQAETEDRRRHIGPANQPAARTITDRCLELLCLKPATPPS